MLVWDDETAIAKNQGLRSLWPPAGALWAPTDTTLAGRPVASYSFALNYAMGDPGFQDLRAYHATNLLIHVLAAVCLFGIVWRSLDRPRLRDRWQAAAPWCAAAVALLWVVHPLTTQAVTYVVQRVESLMGLFVLLTLYAAIRAADDDGSRRWWSAAAVTACALGMGTKEVAVMAPVLVVLWDRCFLEAGAWRRRRGLYAGLAATWLLLAALLASPARPHSVGIGLGGWSSWSYLVTQAEVIVHYLHLAVWPVDLVFDYRWPRADGLTAVWPQALLLLALAAATIAGIVRRQPAAFLGAWFFLILAPTSSLLPIPTEVAAEHRMYLPLAAIVAGGVLGLAAAGRLQALRLEASRSARLATAGAAGLAVLVLAAALGTATSARNTVYASAESLLLDTIAKRPGNANARLAYASSLVTAGRLTEAEPHLRALVALDADASLLAHGRMFLGSALCATGRLGEGIGELELALRLDPTLSDAHALLGEAYDGLGRMADAAVAFDRAVAATPDNPVLLRRVAWFLATSWADDVRNGPRAAVLAERACRLTEWRGAGELESLGAAYAELRRFEDAARALEQAAALASARGDTAFLPVLSHELSEVRARRPIRADHP